MRVFVDESVREMRPVELFVCKSADAEWCTLSRQQHSQTSSYDGRVREGVYLSSMLFVLVSWSVAIAYTRDI